VADATAEEPCVCRRFASDIFFRSYPFVIAGFDPAIHAEASLAQRFHQRLVASRQHGPLAQAFEERRSANGYARW
jgi:hypothetical protein